MCRRKWSRPCRGLEAPGPLADLVTTLLDLTAAEKQEILETIDLRARLDKVVWRLAYRLEVLRLSADIGKRTRDTMTGKQREFMLREQLKTIQKELGEDDDQSPELQDLKRALGAAGLPEDVERQANRELRRLERMQEGSPETGMIRTLPRMAVRAAMAAGRDAADRHRRRPQGARR